MVCPDRVRRALVTPPIRLERPPANKIAETFVIKGGVDAITGDLPSRYRPSSGGSC